MCISILLLLPLIKLHSTVYESCLYVNITTTSNWFRSRANNQFLDRDLWEIWWEDSKISAPIKSRSNNYFFLLNNNLCRCDTWYHGTYQVATKGGRQKTKKTCPRWQNRRKMERTWVPHDATKPKVKPYPDWGILLLLLGNFPYFLNHLELDFLSFEM